MRRRPAVLSTLLLVLVAPRAAAQCPIDTLAAADAESGALFGRDLSVDGATALVGAHLDDEAGPDAGAAYVLERTGGTWVETRKLLPPVAGPYRFGRAVALDAGRAVVGARDDRFAFDAGAGFLYRRGPGGWELESELLAESPAHGDDAGAAVALRGDRVVLGAPVASLDEGFAVVLEPGPGGWREVARLHPRGPELVLGFGTTVALGADRILVGANASAGTAAVYAFELGPAGWVQVARLVGSDAAGSSGYGHALALEGDRAVLAQPHAGPGRAYVFERVGGAWLETARLAGSGDPGISFGASCALRGERIAVGGLDGSAWGIAEDYAEVFRLRAGAWVTEARLEQLRPGAISGFGASVALCGDALLVGAPSDSTAATFAGGVQAFELPRPVAPVCAGAPTSLGVPAELALRCAGSATALSLEAAPVPAGVGLVLYGDAVAAVPAWDGVRCVGGTVARSPVAAVAGGVLAAELELARAPAGLLRPGSTVLLQAWFRDPAAGGSGAALSSAVAVTLGP